MTPNELSADTPISEVKYPVFKSLIVSFWDNFKFFLFVSIDDLFCYGVYFYKPLFTDNGFYFCSGSFSIAYFGSMFLYFEEISF